MVRQSFCRFIGMMGMFTKEFMEEGTAGIDFFFIASRFHLILI
jgi:hypothetical protein